MRPVRARRFRRGPGTWRWPGRSGHRRRSGNRNSEEGTAMNAAQAYRLPDRVDDGCGVGGGCHRRRRASAAGRAACPECLVRECLPRRAMSAIDTRTTVSDPADTRSCGPVRCPTPCPGHWPPLPPFPQGSASSSPRCSSGAEVGNGNLRGTALVVLLLGVPTLLTAMVGTARGSTAVAGRVAGDARVRALPGRSVLLRAHR